MKIRSLLIGVIIMLSFSACGKQKYTVNFDGGFFESKRTQYAAGEKVTVRYDIIATDTDYHFYIDDDVEMKQTLTEDTCSPSSCRIMMLLFMRSRTTVWSITVIDGTSLTNPPVSPSSVDPLIPSDLSKQSYDIARRY